MLSYVKMLSQIVSHDKVDSCALVDPDLNSHRPFWFLKCINLSLLGGNLGLNKVLSQEDREVWLIVKLAVKQEKRERFCA